MLVLNPCLHIGPALANDMQSSGTATTTQADRSGQVPAPDYSGKTRSGKASFYSDKLAGETMADGTPMNPASNVAASKTLPLGTKARVTNLENGKSAVVDIRDRGPYVDGRIVDVSPKVAQQLKMKKQGVATVTVTPLELPQKKSKRAGQRKLPPAGQNNPK